ncbi:hypothetical protein AA957_29390 [Pseudomonas trivialis]|uniref:Uncharacterized protein n=1 Tax=Pseudomonas trivialis TaxID=200450 RepID=A0A0H5A3X8_9PSED|nr:hypothetical protein AA957_00040 [Pseudomonas trivialis]AKS04583.1 hypothetical protein AA957_00085 [Pseudomonas trivialis]AKS10051.1 hypothetical protein AA957_29390 [Pseudomonas trivialis]
MLIYLIFFTHRSVRFMLKPLSKCRKLVSMSVMLSPRYVMIDLFLRLTHGKHAGFQHPINL